MDPLIQVRILAGQLRPGRAPNAQAVTSPPTNTDAGDPPSTGGAGADLSRPSVPDALAGVILAAGQGTRMRSTRPKVLHAVAGTPLIQRVLDLAEQVGARDPVLVLGHQADQVRAALPSCVRTVVQAPQLGTGHAVQAAAELLRAHARERLLVLYGDAALVRPASLRRLVDLPVGPRAPLALLTARVKDPGGYGRVVRGGDGMVVRLVEEAEATDAERAIDEVHSGVLLAWQPWLWEHLWRLPRRPKGEFYLTDLVNLANEEGQTVLASPVDDEEEVHGVNDRAQLAQANAILWRRAAERLMASGVTILDPAHTYIEPGVEIEPDAVVHPGCHLRGTTRIGTGCEIGPDTEIVDSAVGEGSRVWRSVLEGARVGRDVRIGPFAHLRPGAMIEDGVTLGNYAEVKGSRIGAGTQMHHFSYVGDADLGANVNVGAGTITANFDSETRLKNRTVVEDDASLGTDTLLVAPVRVGARAMTGAGAVVTRDIPADEVWAGVPARRLRTRARPADTETGAADE